MASIISATHKTYDNLKIIESVMSGLVKSKRLEKMSVPTTPINKYRSKSMESDIFFYPRNLVKNNRLTKAVEEVNF